MNNEWIKWEGTEGTYPASVETEVAVIFHNGDEALTMVGSVDWKTVAKYRIIKALDHKALARLADDDAKQYLRDYWIDWAGGPCPVDSNTEVQVEVRGGTRDVGPAKMYHWDRGWGKVDIIKYHIVIPVNQWIDWKGGECPVHPETMVCIRGTDHNGAISEPQQRAGSLYWEHWDKARDIISYMVVSPTHPINCDPEFVALKQELEEVRQKLHQERIKGDGIFADCTSAIAQGEKLGRERDEALAQVENFGNQRSSLWIERDEVTQERDQLKHDVESMREERDDKNDRLIDVRRHLTLCLNDYKTLHQQRDKLKEELRSLKTVSDGYNAEADRLSKHGEELQRLRYQMKKERDALQTALETTQNQRDDCSGQLDRIRDGEITVDSPIIKEMMQQRDEAFDELDKVQAKYDELKMWAASTRDILKRIEL